MSCAPEPVPGSTIAPSTVGKSTLECPHIIARPSSDQNGKPSFVLQYSNHSLDCLPIVRGDVSLAECPCPTHARGDAGLWERRICFRQRTPVSPQIIGIESNPELLGITDDHKYRRWPCVCSHRDDLKIEELAARPDKYRDFLYIYEEPWSIYSCDLERVEDTWSPICPHCGRKPHKDTPIEKALLGHCDICGLDFSSWRTSDDFLSLYATHHFFNTSRNAVIDYCQDLVLRFTAPQINRLVLELPSQVILQDLPRTAIKITSIEEIVSLPAPLTPREIVSIACKNNPPSLLNDIFQNLIDANVTSANERPKDQTPLGDCRINANTYKYNFVNLEHHGELLGLKSVLGIQLMEFVHAAICTSVVKAVQTNATTPAPPAQRIIRDKTLHFETHAVHWLSSFCHLPNYRHSRPVRVFVKDHDYAYVFTSLISSLFTIYQHFSNQKR